MVGSRSTMTASYPAIPTSIAAWIPEMPPPMISARRSTGISIACNGTA